MKSLIKQIYCKSGCSGEVIARNASQGLRYFYEIQNLQRSSFYNALRNHFLLGDLEQPEKEKKKQKKLSLC